MTNSASRTILQFGTGKFLRAFADLFVHEMNGSGTRCGSIVAVQSTGSGRASQFNAAGGRYQVAIRGIQNGRHVDRIVEVSSVGRALAAQTDWPHVLAVARSEPLSTVVSNATEAGYALDPRDGAIGHPPQSFPAKLAAVLAARFEAGQPGLTILPCELLEGNGRCLRQLVLDQVARWALSESLVTWIREACAWRNTLVDRIVSAPRADDPIAQRDPLFAVAEPFALWLIEGTAAAGPFAGHPAVRLVDALQPYHLRKVRILNGAHTALVAKARPLGFETVGQAVADPAIAGWLDQLLFGEIVPTLEGRTENPEHFARQCLERFANPFLEHRLADIALTHDVKVRTRLLPTYHEFQDRFGRTPRLLAEVVAGAA